MTRSALAISLALALTLAQEPAGAAQEARGPYAGRLLTDVLKELQGRDLRIVYSSSVVRPDMRVKTEPLAREPRQILEQVLAQHGLTTEKAPGGALIVVRAPARSSAGRPPASGASGTIKGRVLDAVTGAPLAGVLVQVVGRSQETRSDDQGRFELVGVAAGPNTLFVSVVGYALVRRAIEIAAGATLEITIPLSPGTGTYTEEVTVTAGRFATREPAAPAEMTLGSGELQNLRGVLADDPMRAVQSLPGVATGDDFRSEFSVRGLAYRNVGVSIEGVSTPWLVHAVYGRETTGSVAMINSDVLEQATLLAGAHPRRLADRAGAELDFTMRAGSRERFGLRGAVSGTNAGVVFEGPLGRAGRGSWLASIRQSYLHLLIEAVDKGNAFGFTDGQAKFVYDLSPRHRIDLNVIAGRSRLEEEEPAGGPGPNTLDDATNRTAVVNASWRSTVGAAFVLTQRGYFVHHTFTNDGAFGQQLGHGTDRELAYKADIALSRSPSALVQAGAHFLRLEGSQRLVQYGFAPPGVSVRRVDEFDGRGWQSAGYLHLQWAPAAWIMIAPGARFSHQTIVDENAVSPWLLTEWRFSPAWSLRVAGGVSHQYSDIAQAVGPGGSALLEPERTATFDVAVEHRIGDSIRWRVGAYTREDRGFLRLEDSEVRLQDGQIVRPLGPGEWRNALDGTARGVELMVQRESPDGLSGWFAYAYGRTRYDDRTTGERFWGDFDQRHAVSLYAQYRFTDRTAFLAKLRAGSNFPIPGYLEQRDETYFVADQRNLARLPSYARLDLRANRIFNYDKRRLTLFVEVLNVLNRTNARPSGYSVRATGEAVGVTETLFPILPSAGILIEF